MKILAFDTSGKSASLAVLEDEHVLGEIFLDLDIHHSEILLPAVDDLCRTTGVGIQAMDLFACTEGPGSFTGLRIGLATMKGLVLATGKPIVGVSTLESLAWSAAESLLTICPMLDARKDQIYTALYRRDPSGPMLNPGPDRLAELDSFLAGIAEPTLFLGDGAVRYRSLIETALSDRARFGEPFQNHIRGAIVGFLGYRKYRECGGQDPLLLTPRYLRLSEAEEKRRHQAGLQVDKY